MTTEDLPDFVVNRLPDRARKIYQEYGRSDSFRTLCEDLHTCAEALARWKSSDSPSAPERVDEYTQSLRELELEIEEWLKLLEP